MVWLEGAVVVDRVGSAALRYLAVCRFARWAGLRDRDGAGR